MMSHKHKEKLTYLLYRMLLASLCIIGFFTSFEPGYLVAQTTPTEALSVVWSPNGEFLAGAGTNGLLRIWNAQTGAIVRDFQGANGTLFSVTWSPDSTLIASAGDNKIIQIWDVTNGQLQASLLGHEAIIVSVDWSPDGTKLASASASIFEGDYSLRIWDAINYQPITQKDVATATAVVWHPNLMSNKLAITSTNGYTSIMELDGNVIQPQVSFLGNSAQMAVAWNLDGSKLATGDLNGQITIWDATGNALASLTGHSDYVSALAWYPDDTRLASASIDGTVRIWNTTTGQIVDIFSNAIYASRNSIAWNPNANELAFAIADSSMKIIRFPTAAAGNDELVIDTDNNSPEVVTLNGATSSDPDGTIINYLWSENSIEIATGVNPQVNLSAGVHEIMLTVTDDDGATSSDIVVITVEVPSIICSSTVLDTPALLTAIISANTTPEPDTICLEAGMYTLDTPITSDITLVGLGAGAEIIGSLQVSGAGRLTLRNVSVTP